MDMTMYTDWGSDYLWNYWDMPVCGISLFYGLKLGVGDVDGN